MNSETTDDLQVQPTSDFPRPGFYRQHFRKILLVFLFLAPGYLWISARVLTPGDMSAYILDVTHWLPRSSQWINDMEKFSEVIGRERGRVIRVSWPGCREDDPRLKSFAAALKELKRVPRFVGMNQSEHVFDEVITIDSIIERMRNTSGELSEEQAYAQLSNVLIGPDGTTCVLAMLPVNDPAQRAYAIEQIYTCADRIDGLSSRDIRMFGGPVYTKQVDDSGIRLATVFTPVSALVSLICAWFCLRNLHVMLAVFLNAIVCTCAALVSLYVTRAPMDPLLMLLPGFWFIMSMSNGIHFTNYYLELASNNKTEDDPSSMAAGIAFKPSLIATLTTCIGLGALCTSDILPVWRFGFHAAIGLFCGFITCFLFLPSWFSFTRGRWMRAGAIRPVGDGGFWDWYADKVRMFGARTTILFIGMLILAVIGFSRLSFSNKLSDQFARTSRLNTDAAWFEQQIGPLLPFEVLVRFPRENLPRPSACLGYVSELQQRLADSQLPCTSLSATAVVPYNAGGGARQAMRRAIMDKRLERHRGALAETGFVIDDGDFELWRLTIFAYNSVGLSMKEYFAVIQQAVAEQSKHAAATGLNPGISYAGLGSRMAVITRKLGGGLLQSCFTSAILISLVVIVAMRSFALGMTAMLPNIFPVVISFGFYGFFQPRLDIGSIMTASIAMGIAVDDTIHFMYWFRKGMRNNLSRVDAVKLAIKKCGRAIASTSLICGLGFFVFSFCDFMPAARFGQLLFMMLAAALVGDLLFLPALLQSLPQRLLDVARQKYSSLAPDGTETGRNKTSKAI